MTVERRLMRLVVLWILVLAAFSGCTAVNSSGTNPPRLDPVSSQTREVTVSTPRDPENGEWLSIVYPGEQWYLYSKPKQVIVDEEASELTYELLIRKGETGKVASIFFMAVPEKDIMWAPGSDQNDWRVVEPSTLPHAVFGAWYEFDSGEPADAIAR